jgi:hypothetical protein
MPNMQISMHSKITVASSLPRLICRGPPFIETDFPHHDATVKFLPLLKPIEASYPGL